MTIKNTLCCEESKEVTVYKGYPEIKDTKTREGRENHRCECYRPSHSQRLGDFHLFLPIKKHPASLKFHKDEKVKNEVTTWLRAQEAELYDIGKQKLIPRLNKCVVKGGDYI
jgi:hypothetical protein